MKAKIFAAVSLLALATLWVIPARAALTPGGEVVLVAQGEELDVYDIATGALQSDPLIPASGWVNGTPCFIPGDPSHHFIEADDNPDLIVPDGVHNGDERPFFGKFARDGSFSGNFIGWNLPMKDPAGCTFDANGNFIGADVGESLTPFMGDGQVAIFFKTSEFNNFCVLDTGLTQPGMLATDEQGRIYVPESGSGQIVRYSNLPTSWHDCHPPTKEVWFNGLVQGVFTPIGIVRAPGGGWAVSSVLVPNEIVHVNDLGLVDGIIAIPGPLTGNPFGMAYDSEGNLYYADLGLTVFPGGPENPDEPIGPADDAGTLKVVRAGGLPIPETIADGFDFPDGVAVVPADWINL